MRNPTLGGEFEYERCGYPVQQALNWDPVSLSANYKTSIHETAVIGENAEWVGKDTKYFVKIGNHTIIRAFVTIDAGVQRNTAIGDDCLIMAHTHIGHDVWVGDRAQIAPHASIGGCVTIGTDVKIGMGALIKPWVIIGNGARIGMGAVITRDVPPGEVWVGSPGRKLEK